MSADATPLGGALLTGISGGFRVKRDAERVSYLFELYQRYTSLLPADSSKPKRRTRGRSKVND